MYIAFVAVVPVGLPEEELEALLPKGITLGIAIECASPLLSTGSTSWLNSFSNFVPGIAGDEILHPRCQQSSRGILACMACSRHADSEDNGASIEWND